MRIGVNCGHTKSGTKGSGAVGFINESDETRAVGYDLISLLKSAGHIVVDCTNDVSLTVGANLRNICKKANAQPLDLFLSIHFNAGGGKGCETLTYSGKDVNKAGEINRALSALGFKNRGVKNGSRVYVLKNTNAPAVLAEICFVDTKEDAELYKSLGAQRVAQAVFEAVTGGSVKQMINNESVAKTVYSLNNVHVQVIDINKFKIKQVSERKKNINEPNYANAGFFAKLNDGSTIPVGNLAIDGRIITDAKTQASWLSTAGKQLTTLVIYKDNTAEFVKTADLNNIKNLKYAISGVPIIKNGYKVSLEDIIQEGYSGGELYNTWHGFIGIRNNRLVYVADNSSFTSMVYLLEVLGIENAIKLDGGGSFILHNGGFEVATNENRKIDNILIWEG